MADYATFKHAPQELRAKILYRGNLDTRQFYACTYALGAGGVLELCDVLFESSDKVEGITLTEKWSYRKMMLISPAYHWTLALINPEEVP